MEEEERREEVPVEWVDAQEWAAIESVLASALTSSTSSDFCSRSSWRLNGCRNDGVQQGNTETYNASNTAPSKSSTPTDSSFYSLLNGARSEDIRQESGLSPPIEETLPAVASSSFTTSHQSPSKESGKRICSDIEETEEYKGKRSDRNSPIKWVEARDSTVIKSSCAGDSSLLNLLQEKASILPLEDTCIHEKSATPNQLNTGNLQTSQELLSCSTKTYIDHETIVPTKRPRRVLPQWGQTKAGEAGVPKKDARSGKEFASLETELPSERLETSWPVLGQTNLSKLTNSWARTQSDCEGKIRSKAPLLQFKGRIVYSKSEEEVDAAAHELLEAVRAKKEVASGDVPIGFDMEWKASFQRGEAAGKVAVVQLCVESSRCDVMHIMHSGIPSALASLLRDSSILKVGVGSFGDAAKLRRDYEVQTQGVVDLSILANQKLGTGALIDPYTFKQWSLSSLAYELTCKQVEKVASIRTGDWESCPLSQVQLVYAATDAFASLYLYQVLETFPNQVVKN